MYPATRSEAKCLGSTRYFTGEPCKKGHTALRITDSGVCVECRKEMKAAKTAADRAAKGLPPLYRPTCEEDRRRHIAEYKQQWFEQNKEKNLQRIKAWSERNKDRVLAAKRKYREANPVVDRVNVGRRRAAKLQRTASWADQNFIRFFYATRAYMSMETGLQWHVDHIVPLRGRLVSGLHTHHNLRVTPAVDNMKKGNRFVA